jgi:hypothetical protein
LDIQDSYVGKWLDWLDNGGPGDLAFDLDGSGSRFYMGLGLSGLAPGGVLDFYGESVSLQEGVLEVKLQVSECQDCTFNAVIFWVEDVVTRKVSTYTGDSQEFDVSPGNPPAHPVDMHVWLERVGSIRCRLTSDYRGEITLAAMDAEQMVIFPPVIESVAGAGSEILLPDIPTGRRMTVLYRAMGAGVPSDEPVATDVVVQQEGEESVVEISL